MKLGKLRLKNYVFFKEAVFDLDQQGITYIQALNKDAASNEAKNTNGAGKSLLFGSIPELHWGTSPTGKDSVKSEQSSVISIEYKDVGKGKDNYVVQRRFGKKKGFRILRNGEDTNIRTIDLASKRAQSILGMGEQDFYTRAYIDALIPHPLIVGRDGERQQFFVDMFGLHSADSIRKLLTSEYREAQKNRASYLEVRSLFEEMREKSLDSDTYAAKVKELAELSDKQSSLLKRFRRTQAIRDLIMFERDNAGLIKRLRNVVDGGGFDYVLETVTKEIKRLRADQAEAQEWAVFDKETARYKEKLKPMQKRLDRLGLGDADHEAIKAKAKKARELEAHASLTKSEWKQVGRPGDKPEKVTEPSYDRAKCEARLYALKEEKQHVQKFHKGKCPTCGSKVEGRTLEEIVADIKKWEDRAEAASAYTQYKAALSTWKERTDASERLGVEYKDAKAKAEKYERYQEALDLIKGIPDVPQPPSDSRLPADGLEERLDKYKSKLEVLRSAQPVIDKINEVENLTESQRALAKSFDELGDKLTALNNRIADLSAETNSAKTARNQLELLAARGKTLKKKAADEPILKMLIEAYSKKGLKKLMIERFAKLLEAQLNKFRKLLFIEDYQFEFRFDKKLELLVHRRYGKITKVSDVRKLSGAERRMFTVLLVVATITLLPASKRLNVLILDEPDANVGPAQLDRFLKALPVIQKIVPHIVVITPRLDLDIPNANVYTVVKHRGVSTLVKGSVK
jgi:DNA repair exonuclease SbcCD ATPase subunit